ncbi:ADP-ribosylation factor-like protein 2-binding protein [Zootermopsis nevadensis]|uniref:ADP-ribosylation factor-like protein 2-binding protein n=1 Tax=Zootermopsis nevadensis TaxID=136037 RepID=A0A067R0L5_ZOONE|nr:ADP-ribosylation factor-like protein 2-binding protein [Zootermopsis nevadensis]XP_021935368.1 ADP-ribosylation factor-like protein 2-binding protein [Zootermopsis nevadensis]XP_021935369.1 ADP-ribosylation factor-like protein 2-binding protein [Zootermopsis nevadensis]XP_021935370.1 ADP-ribosylation factor-like protein 2-binding protein [Zootermopsis nevadensis]XP_021935371.1 ADP-ribosylation factor-like protein 2-binding protein [Zootermopsis nevadensis]KDR10997.1 ADP-ribosylation factor-
MMKRFREQCRGFESKCSDDLEIVSTQASDQDIFFDSVIGHIEDILMEENFQELQKCFMEKYWHEFEDEEENKLCYMNIFKEYTDTIEKHIEIHLVKMIPNFSMDEFIEQLQTRKNELNGEVFEMLFTFSDFIAFKEMFLDYKAMKDGRVEDLSKGICITSGILH